MHKFMIFSHLPHTSIKICIQNCSINHKMLICAVTGQFIIFLNANFLANRAPNSIEAKNWVVHYQSERKS